MGLMLRNKRPRWLYMQTRRLICEFLNVKTIFFFICHWSKHALYKHGKIVLCLSQDTFFLKSTKKIWRYKTLSLNVWMQTNVCAASFPWKGIMCDMTVCSCLGGWWCGVRDGGSWILGPGWDRLLWRFSGQCDSKPFSVKDFSQLF